MRHLDLLSIFVAAVSVAAALPACSSSSSACDGLPPPENVTVSMSALEGAQTVAGTADAGLPRVGEELGYATCPIVCPEHEQSCTVTSITGDQATLTCTPMCTGRRPVGYSGPQDLATDGGAHFARMAALEAASVVAFRVLARELSLHRAPRSLVNACRRAARDEVRHARATSALARAYGGAAAPWAVERQAPRAIEAIALENAVEGCVRETFGALLAHWQAREARDPAVRAVMKRIARDETRHAALSWSIDAWARSRLDRAARGRLDGARADAVRALAVAGAPATRGHLAAAVGLPSPAQERALAASLERTLFAVSAAA
jgi:hypothetical protein